jgi:hypothetical protein
MAEKHKEFTADGGQSYTFKWTIPGDIQLTTTVTRSGKPVDIAGDAPASGKSRQGKMVITVTRDGQPVDFDGTDPKATVEGSNWSFTSTIQSATVGKVVYTIQCNSPGADTHIATGTIAGSQRLRVSIFDFNGSFANGLVKGKRKTYVWRDDLFDGLKRGRVDDYTMVSCIGFDTANPTKPRWVMAPNGDFAADNCIEYLKQVKEKLKAIHVQLCVGFAMVFHSAAGADKDGHGDALAAFLAGTQAATLAQNIVKIFTGNGIAIDGVNFDFEVDKLGAAQGQGMETLIVETAKAMPAGGWVSYANAPFLTDGQNEPGFMKIQPYSLAAKAPNIIARPMCYGETSSVSADVIGKSADCALADPSSGGGGLKPSAVQMGIWGDKFAGSLGDFCRDVLRPKKVGLMIYPGQQFGAGILDKTAIWEKALNPGAAAPGTSGSPLQVPLA